MRILLVEDDPDNVNDITSNLRKNYILDVAYSGIEGTYLSQVNDYDVILIDSRISDMDALELCKTTRSSEVIAPILLLGEPDTSCDYKVKALDSGADVIVSKPLNNEELNANIRAMIRRNNHNLKDNTIKVSHFEINIKTYQFFYKTNEINLRKKEFEIVMHLMINKNRVVSKEELLDHIWEDGICSMSNTLEVHVRSIRKKIDEKLKLSFIRTVKGFGYVIKDIC